MSQRARSAGVKPKNRGSCTIGVANAHEKGGLRWGKVRGQPPRFQKPLGMMCKGLPASPIQHQLPLIENLPGYP